MIVNEICELNFFDFLRKWGGIYTAFYNHKHLLEKQGITVLVNSWKKSDITHVHSYGPFGLYKLMRAKHGVTTTHIVPQTMVGSFKGDKVLLKLVVPYLRFFYNQSELVVALSLFAKKELEDIGVTTKIAILPNAINTERFVKDTSLKMKGRKKHGIGEKEFVVMSVGQVIPRKGVATFIAVARRFPEYKFIWVGAQPIKSIGNQKDSLVHNLPQNMIITGSVGYDEMPMYYNLADVFLFPSYQETQGLVIVEAAACGLPVIIRDLEQYRQLYKDHFLPSTTDDEFIHALSLLSKDKSKYAAMVKESEQLANDFTMETVGKKHVKLYIELLEKKPFNTHFLPH